MEDKVITILKTLSGKEEIEPFENLHDSVGLDSFAMIMLLLMIEESFEIVLEESDLDPTQLVTVNDVLLLVGKYYKDDNEDEEKS